MGECNFRRGLRSSLVAEIRRRVENQRERQGILRESTASSQQMMNQLLEIQRLSLEKGVSLSDEEQQALSEAEQLFLFNQRQFQQLNQEIAGLSEELQDLQDQQRQIEQRLERERRPIERQYA